MAFGDTVYGGPAGSPPDAGGWWGGAQAGLGALGDIYTMYQNQQARAQQQKLYDIQSNPAKLAQYIGGLYQPMTAQVGDAVRRQMIAPNWAAMTGGATGGALNQFIADALAKLEAQRYGDTQRTALGALGSAGGNIPAQSGQFNLGSILKSLQTLRGLGTQQRQPGLTDFGTSPDVGLTGIPNMAGAMPATTFAPDMNVMGGVY